MNPNNPSQVRIEDAQPAGDLMAQQGIDPSTLPKPNIVAPPSPQGAPNVEVVTTTPLDHQLPTAGTPEVTPNA